LNNDLLSQALRGARQGVTPTIAPLGSALVVGAGGVLGAAVLAEALVAGRFSHVKAAVTGPLKSALRGFEPWPAARLDDAAAAPPADTAFIVFERPRHHNGRDELFMRPEPAALLGLATALKRLQVRRMLVVIPHAPALLPAALKAGLANLDETAVAALGFEHLVFIRASQDSPSGPRLASVLERFARWWLGQLRWMVPQSEQPVRAATLATLAVQLARALPLAPTGTRVVPQDLLSRAASAPRPDQVLSDWLHGRIVPGSPP
jgi:hypothetical protein